MSLNGAKYRARIRDCLNFKRSSLITMDRLRKREKRVVRELTENTIGNLEERVRYGALDGGLQFLQEGVEVAVDGHVDGFAQDRIAAEQVLQLQLALRHRDLRLEIHHSQIILAVLPARLLRLQFHQAFAVGEVAIHGAGSFESQKYHFSIHVVVTFDEEVGEVQLDHEAQSVYVGPAEGNMICNCFNSGIDL